MKPQNVRIIYYDLKDYDKEIGHRKVKIFEVKNIDYETALDYCCQYIINKEIKIDGMSITDFHK